jgi:hypothetical protein
MTSDIAELMMMMMMLIYHAVLEAVCELADYRKIHGHCKFLSYRKHQASCVG